MKATLERFYSGEDCTLGKISLDGTTLFTIERPWLDNKNNVSCIPAGTYRVIWSRSPRLKKFTYEVLNVPGRGGIRIHAGNRAADSLGCPLLGLRVGAIGKDRAVLASRSAVAKFEDYFQRKSFTLEVKNV
jgi:hypothetical protein